MDGLTRNWTQEGPPRSYPRAMAAKPALTRKPTARDALHASEGLLLTARSSWTETRSPALRKRLRRVIEQCAKLRVEADRAA